MDIVLQLLVEALLLGTFYAFMSLGFSLTWGVLNIINLAYGSYIILGSYLAYTLYTSAGLDPILSLPISFTAGFLLGLILQSFLMNRVMTLEPFMILILTFGLDIFIANTLNLLFRADIRSIDVPYAERSHLIGPLIITEVKAVVFVLSLVLTGFVYILLHRTWTGRAIRAVALDREGARIVGVSPEKVFLITSGIGTGIALSSGNLYGVLQGFTPFDGGMLTVKAFLVSIVGGLGRVESALAGGLFLGVLEVFTGFYLGEGWKFFASLIAMFLFLILRPRGLLGGKYYGEV